METYKVKLELFEGPLDLLLYLIKKQDMDIKEIRISEITQEYLTYIELMKDLNLEMAGEFLVMASSLLEIKAKSLLPSNPKNPENPEDGPDPRTELIAKLLEYQKYKEAASFLSQREFAGREVYYRNVMPIFSEGDFTLDATLFDLLDAFKDVLKGSTAEVKEFIYQEIPIEQKIREILDALEGSDYIQFHQIFAPNKTRRELIITFLALLELIRLKQIIARQSKPLDEIWIYRVQEASVAADPSSLEIENKNG